MKKLLTCQSVTVAGWKPSDILHTNPSNPGKMPRYEYEIFYKYIAKWDIGLITSTSPFIGPHIMYKWVSNCRTVNIERIAFWKGASLSIGMRYEHMSFGN